MSSLCLCVSVVNAFMRLTLLAALAMTVPTQAAELTRERASAFAKLALTAIRKEYPNKPEHVLGGPADVKSPKGLHPAFYGSYDWHSSVHGHWLLVRLLKTYPDLPEARDVRAALGRHLAAANKMAEEMHGWDDPDGKAWAANLKPLADAVAARYVSYFPKQTYPIRTGVHPK